MLRRRSSRSADDALEAAAAAAMAAEEEEEEAEDWDGGSISETSFAAAAAPAAFASVNAHALLSGAEAAAGAGAGASSAAAAAAAAAAANASAAGLPPPSHPPPWEPTEAAYLREYHGSYGDAEEGGPSVALGESYRRHLRAMQGQEGSSSETPSGSDTEGRGGPGKMPPPPPPPPSSGRVIRPKAAADLAPAAAGEGEGGAEKEERGRQGRRSFTSMLRKEDVADIKRRLSERDDSGSLSGAMARELGVPDDGSIDSGGPSARRRRRRGVRLTLPQKMCVALAAVAAVAGAVLAVVLPRNSSAAAAAKRTAGEVGLALKVIVSGKEAAGLPVDRKDGDGKGGGDRMIRSDADSEAAEASRSAEDRVDGGSNSQVDEGGEGGNNREMMQKMMMRGRPRMVPGIDSSGDHQFRALEQLHRPVRHVGAAAAMSDEQGAHQMIQGGIDNPNVLPPLEAYSTASGPDESGIYIPDLTSRNYADVWTPVHRVDVPMFWHVPKSGGTTMQDVLGGCLGMVQASNPAAGDGNDRRFRNQLRVYTNGDGVKYVNVDTTSPEGLQRAERLGLVPSGMADVVVARRLHDASSLFDYARRGRAFAMFRHPAKRAASMFARDASLSDMTLLEYAHSDRAEENWVVRSLTNEFEEPVGVQHVEVAKEILRRKVLVGITEFFDQSVVRFEQYFGWWDGVANNVDVLRCQRDRMAGGDNRNDHPQVGPGTEEFQALAMRNWADVELYHYAKTLFQEQASLV